LASTGRVRLDEATMDFERFRTVEGFEEFKVLVDKADRWLGVEPHEPESMQLRRLQSFKTSDNPDSK
jgi:hypothetical protein